MMNIMITVFWKLCCTKPESGFQVIAASSRGQGNAEIDSAGYPVSPRTGCLQLSVMAGECLVQHDSKQKESPDRTTEVNVERAVKY